ncbi:MAG: hypothetical protein AAF699_16910 [Pseudomonadota bacterium]
MFKTCIRLVISLAFVLVSSTTRADGPFVTDFESGLDWLKLSETAGMEYNAALAMFPGWRHATNLEVENLFAKRFPGFVPNPLTGAANPYPTLNDDARAFIAAFGVTFDSSGPVWSVGVYTDEDENLTILGALELLFDAGGSVLGPEYRNNAIITANPRYGIFLVRGTDETPSENLEISGDPEIPRYLTDRLSIAEVSSGDVLSISSSRPSIVQFSASCSNNSPQDFQPTPDLVMPGNSSFSFCVHGENFGDTTIIVDSSDGRSGRFDVTVTPMVLGFSGVKTNYYRREPSSFFNIVLSRGTPTFLFDLSGNEIKLRSPLALSPLVPNGFLNYRVRSNDSLVAKLVNRQGRKRVSVFGKIRVGETGKSLAIQPIRPGKAKLTASVAAYEPGEFVIKSKRVSVVRPTPLFEPLVSAIRSASILESAERRSTNLIRRADVAYSNGNYTLARTKMEQISSFLFLHPIRLFPLEYEVVISDLIESITFQITIAEQAAGPP